MSHYEEMYKKLLVAHEATVKQYNKLQEKNDSTIVLMKRYSDRVENRISELEQEIAELIQKLGEKEKLIEHKEIKKSNIKLTKREHQVLTLLALPYKDIANKLGVECSTVRCHISHLSYKFPEQINKVSIMIEALKLGLIELDEIVTE